MKIGLESRVKRLERELTSSNRIIVIFNCSSPGETKLLGYENHVYGHERIVTMRIPGESDEQLLERTMRTAKSSGGGLFPLYAIHGPDN